MADGECIEAVHQLYLYLDGELTDDRRHVIRQHLDICPPCLRAYDFESELRVVISEKCRDHVPDDLRVRIYEAIRNLEE